MRRAALTCLMLALLAPPAARPESAIPAEAVTDVRIYLERLGALGLAGVVVVTERGRPLVVEAVGSADREAGRAWTPATVSTIGSITKQFTGAGILLLAERGALDVGDPITRYFEGVPDDKRDITLHHLLTHSSGIVDLDGVGDFDPIGRQEFVRRILAQDLAFAPGTGYEYSNAGYSLLGAIIEQLSGES
ncbi:MAG: serine hydrolase domain-containing protein, partial [Thermoanaerobaculia bacterium]|nr:serine hydrolase domain-containing protein [Thermoanaerobaculia bacterium]